MSHSCRKRISGFTWLIRATTASSPGITSSFLKTVLSPHASPNQGCRPIPNRIFHVITVMVESGNGGVCLTLLVYIIASSTSLKLVANGSQALTKSRMTDKKSRNGLSFLKLLFLIVSKLYLSKVMNSIY